MSSDPFPGGSPGARVVVAAPASGHGKTTVATGLLAALRRRSTEVAPFKVGPDYIDPGYHAIAAGRPGRNLDPVLVGSERIAPLFSHGSTGAEVSVVEGVMGLFDGRIDAGGGEPPAFGSTAHVATLLDAPVVLVVDARGQSQSLAALLHGFRSLVPHLRLGGVVLNRVGSRRHERVLREAAESVGLPVLGTLPRTEGLDVPSRHLGLITAAEHGAAADRAVEAMADAVEAGVDLDEVVRLARSAPAPSARPWNPREVIPRREFPASAPTVAVAGGRAFTFGYAEHRELLEAAGARVELVDPLRDERLPPATRGLVLPGGFPEQHAAELAANSSLRAEIAEFAASGAPVHAECAGMLYLTRELDGHAQCGVLDVRARMSAKLTLGYRQAVAASGSVLFDEGTRLDGHEFHRTVVEPVDEPGRTAGERVAPAWHWRGADGVVSEGFVAGGVHASYLHTHPAGSPGAVARFVRRCVE